MKKTLVPKIFRTPICLGFILYVFFFLFPIANLNAQAEVIDSLKQEFSKAKEDSTKCSLLNAMMEFEGDEAKIEEYNTLLLKISSVNQKKYKKGSAAYNSYRLYYADAVNNVGFLHNSKGNPDSALFYMHKALELYTELGNKEGIAGCINNIGFIHQYSGDVAAAQKAYEKGIEIYKKINDQEGIARLHSNIGFLLNNQGDIVGGLDHLMTALNIQEKLGKKEDIANSLHNIAFVYFNQGDEVKALEYYNKSFAIYKQLGNKNDIGNSLNNIGSVFEKQNRNKEALDYFTQALKIYKETGEKKGMAFSLNNIGMIYDKENKTEEAIGYYEASLKIRDSIDEKQGQTFSLCNLAGAQLRLKNIGAAQKYAERGLKISQELGFPENIKRAAELLYTVHKLKNNPAEALKYYELFISMKDSLNAESNKKATIKSQLKYEYEKKAAADSVKTTEEKKVVQAQLKQEQVQRYSLLVGLLLIVVFALFMVNRFRVTNKQKKLIEEQKEIVERQKHIVEEKQKEILDSIHYARRIQRALITSEYYINKKLREHRGSMR